MLTEGALYRAGAVARGGGRLGLRVARGSGPRRARASLDLAVLPRRRPLPPHPPGRTIHTRTRTATACGQRNTAGTMDGIIGAGRWARDGGRLRLRRVLGWRSLLARLPDR